MSIRNSGSAGALLLALAGCAGVAPAPAPVVAEGRYELKDGSVLLVDAAGRMRMFNLYADPVFMRDGTPMELKDGRIIDMKESAIWKALRQRGTLNPRS